MTLQIAGTAGNTLLNALVTCDTLEVYGDLYGPPVIPDTCEDTATGSLLISFDLTAWGTATDGKNLVLSGMPVISTVNVTGTPTYFRLLASDVCKMQGTCGFAGQGADLQFPTYYIDATKTLELVAFQFIAFNSDV